MGVRVKWIWIAALLAVGPASAEEEPAEEPAEEPSPPLSLEELLRPPPTPTEEIDLWIGVDVPVVFHPKFMLGGRFDFGVGRRSDRSFVAGSLKVGYSHPAWITVDALAVLGGTTPSRSSQPFYAVVVGGGVTFDSPEYALRPTSVDDEWTKKSASPTFVVGGSFGYFVGGMQRQRQFRVSLEPRFRGMVTLYEEGSAFMPGAELSLCLGADLL